MIHQRRSMFQIQPHNKRIMAFYIYLVASASMLTATELLPLSVKGKDIVNSNGEVMSMRGINFGGWLMMETWIPSIEMEWHDRLPHLAKEAGIEEEFHQAIERIGEFKDDKENIHDYIEWLHQTLQSLVDASRYERYLMLFQKEPPIYAAKEFDEVLRKRFSVYGAGEIWNAFHDVWITETDFQLAKALGFNFVRIPFWYKWFENEENPYEYTDYGFQYLDKAIAWAEEHGLYITLDFHGAVGGQSPWDHTGELSRGEFFENIEFQKRTASLWREIAKRYAGNTTVFAYDLLNEPFCAIGIEDWTKAHDLMYDTIREVDTDTIIIMEDGYKLETEPWKEIGFFPKPEKQGWKQIVYSIHFYSGSDPLFSNEDVLDEHRKFAEELIRVTKREQDRTGAPIYFGEFSTMDDRPNDIEGMKLFLEMFNREGWHWSPWTFKYVDDNNEGTIWGIYQYNEPWERTPNFHRDSKESILNTISQLTIDHFSLQEEYGKILRECLAQPISSANR